MESTHQGPSAVAVKKTHVASTVEAAPNTDAALKTSVSALRDQLSQHHSTQGARKGPTSTHTSPEQLSNQTRSIDQQGGEGATKVRLLAQSMGSTHQGPSAVAVKKTHVASKVDAAPKTGAASKTSVSALRDQLSQYHSTQGARKGPKSAYFA